MNVNYVDSLFAAIRILWVCVLDLGVEKVIQHFVLMLWPYVNKIVREQLQGVYFTSVMALLKEI